MQRGCQLRLYRSFQNVNLNILSFEKEGEVRFRKPNRLFFFSLERAYAGAYIIHTYIHIRALKYIWKRALEGSKKNLPHITGSYSVSISQHPKGLKSLTKCPFIFALEVLMI